MKKSTASLDAIVSALTSEARRLGLNDARWAAAAGVRKETLSRLRGRASCDYATLEALACVVGLTIGVGPAATRATPPTEHFPRRMDREHEERLLALCTSGNLAPATWRASGPAFFMAGFAVMLASTKGLDRRRLLALAEALHPGTSLPDVFAIWLERSPLRPSRFLPLLAAKNKRAA